MNVLPIDFVALVSVIMGISVVLIPIAGLTARYALKPIVDALGKYLQGQGTEDSIKIVERRLGLLEQQLDEVQGSMNRLVEVSEFDARLRRGAAADVLGPGAAAETSTAGGPRTDPAPESGGAPG